jgi:hypothetical protein
MQVLEQSGNVELCYHKSTNMYVVILGNKYKTFALSRCAIDEYFRLTGITTKFFAYDIPGWCETQVCRGVSWQRAIRGRHIDGAVNIREITVQEYQNIF